MLQQILSLIAQGEVRHRRALAEALDVPEPLVAQMIAQLVQTGYLSEDVACETEACSHCARSAACGTGHSLRLWTLTDKGRAHV